MPKQPKELTERIALYRQWLFYGDIKEIARKTKRTPNMVTMTLTGKRMNKEIIRVTRETALSNARAMGVELNNSGK